MLQGIGGATVWVLVLLILAQVLAVGRSLSAATAELINLAGSPQAAALLLDDFVIVDPPIVLLTDDDKRRSPYVLRLISRMYDDAAPAFVKEDKGGLQLSRVDASLQGLLLRARRQPSSRPATASLPALTICAFWASTRTKHYQTRYPTVRQARQCSWMSVQDKAALTDRLMRAFDTLTKRLHRSRVEVERMLQTHVRVRLK